MQTNNNNKNRTKPPLNPNGTTNSYKIHSQERKSRCQGPNRERDAIGKAKRVLASTKIMDPVTVSLDKDSPEGFQDTKLNEQL